MTTIDHLPTAAQETAEAQGWEDESLIIHLSAFIKEHSLTQELAEYFEAIATEENANQ